MIDIAGRRCALERFQGPPFFCLVSAGGGLSVVFILYSEICAGVTTTLK